MVTMTKRKEKASIQYVLLRTTKLPGFMEKIMANCHHIFKEFFFLIELENVEYFFKALSTK